MKDNALEILKSCDAFLEGHFLLSSGRHSSAYCQMAFLQQYPDKCALVMENVAEQLRDLDVDVIVGPAMGGIVYAYELGRQLGKRAIFTERVDNVMTCLLYTSRHRPQTRRAPGCGRAVRGAPDRLCGLHTEKPRHGPLCFTSDSD